MYRLFFEDYIKVSVVSFLKFVLCGKEYGVGYMNICVYMFVNI